MTQSADIHYDIAAGLFPADQRIRHKKGVGLEMFCTVPHLAEKKGDRDHATVSRLMLKHSMQKRSMS